MEQIIITINKKGEVVITVDGVKGTSCKDLTGALERELGSDSKEILTSEFFEIEQKIRY